MRVSLVALALAACQRSKPALASPPARAGAGGGARIERNLGSMGTTLELVVEGPTRQRCLIVSELAVRELEVAEARLSTWRADSELARLNATPVGTAFELSDELAAELAQARAVWRETDGAFDLAVGGWVRAWDLRGAGRWPSDAEIEAARVPGGLAALELAGRGAVRRHPALVLEEGGFGKGAGLDAVARALAHEPDVRLWADMGGQVLVLGARAQPWWCGVADPRDRARSVLRVALRTGSLSTTGNSERAVGPAGRRVGHVLDPRTGRPAEDFGSVTVWCDSALRADALSTGLFVLGPDPALEFARGRADVGVLVLEPRAAGGLRARVSGRLAAPETVEPIASDLALEPFELPFASGPARSSRAAHSESNPNPAEQGRR